MVDTRNQFFGLESRYLWTALAVYILVTLAIVFAIVRYRRRSGQERPVGKDKNDPLEGAYALVLIGVIAFLVVSTFSTENKVDAVAAHPALRVNVVASQWQWKFVYPKQGITVVAPPHKPTILTVPTDTTISFHASSLDVIHSFYVPYTRFKRDVFPHTTSVFDLVFDKPGVFTGECAEFCGLDHAVMLFSVHAMSPAAFRAWAAHQRAHPSELTQ